MVFVRRSCGQETLNVLFLEPATRGVLIRDHDAKYSGPSGRGRLDSAKKTA